jgi:hypothetical protein
LFLTGWLFLIFNWATWTDQMAMNFRPSKPSWEEAWDLSLGTPWTKPGPQALNYKKLREIFLELLPCCSLRALDLDSGNKMVE